jgi:hypothetical protein
MTAFQAPETKSAEVAAAYDELARAFSAFKDTNETRLAEIETRLSPDPLAEEKLARIGDALDQAQRRIDRIALDARRPALAAAEPRDPAVAEHKAAFQTYVRTGEAAGLKRLEAKALSAGSGPDGGYLVPDTVEREVLRRLAAISPIRAVASVHHLRRALQAGLLDGRSHDRLGRRDRRAAADRRLHARRALLPTDGTLRLARRDADAARRRHRRHRPVDRRRVRERLCRAGGRRLRCRRRGQQAERLPRLGDGRQRRLGMGQARLRRDRPGRRLPGREPDRQADRPDLRVARRLPPERRILAERSGLEVRVWSNVLA